VHSRSKLTSVALACSLLAYTSAAAIARVHGQLAQTEAPTDPNKDKSSPDASEGDVPAKTKKGSVPDKGEKRRDRDGAGDNKDRPPRGERESGTDVAPKTAPPPDANKEDAPAVKKMERKESPIAGPEKNDQPAPKLVPKAAPQATDGQPSEKPKKLDNKALEAAPPKVKAEPKAAPEAEPLGEPKSDANKAPDSATPAPKQGLPSPSGNEGVAPKPDQKTGPDAPRPSIPVLPAPEGKAGAGDKQPSPAASEAKDLKAIKEERKERSEDGGKRIVIEEPDKRAIIKEEGRTIIRHDETERFRRLSRDTRVEHRDGLDISVTVGLGGVQIFTDLDDQGRPLRRYRRGRDGRDVILFDNRDYYKRHRGGGSIVDAIIELPPPQFKIRREQYVVEYDNASDDDVYEALSAPPVEELDRTYALEEVRRSPTLRDRMRRVDLDAINFEFGAWEVTPDQYPALKRVARAMNRVIEANPDEVFLIEGHTDAVGSDEDNLSLSDRRAESVAIILTEEFKVPPENITTQGYGEQYLKVPTDQAERQNRRVAVRRITPLLSQGK
jgi:outer membrane protein OmpA-like peptidoglycan-associated protein